MIKLVPNILTILRFVLIPIILKLILLDEYIWALAFLTISGLTDIVDGFVARHFNCITNFGKLIDPLADKFTQISVLWILVSKSIIPLWILIIVLLKEIIMVSGASFLYGKKFVVSSKWYGKAATVLFYMAIVLSLIINEFNFKFNIDSYFYYLALFTTIFSLCMYFKEFYQKGYLKKDELKID